MKRIAMMALLLLLGLYADPALAQRKPKKGKKKQEAAKESAMLEAMSGRGQAGRAPNEGAAMDAFMEGMKFFILEEFEKAAVFFEEALALSPDNAAVHYQLAASFASIGRFEGALPHAQRAHQLAPENPYYALLLAELYKGQRQYGKAIELYEEMADKGMAGEEEYEDLANLYLSTSRTQEALGVYARMEKAFGFSEHLARSQQRLYLRLNQMDKALEQGERLLEAYPGDPELVLEQVQLMLMAGQTQESADRLEALLEEYPEQTKAKLLLAEAYHKLGEADQANQHLEEAFGNPDTPFESKLDVLAEYLRRSAKPNERKTGTALAKVVAEAHPKEAKAHAIYADFLMTARDPLILPEARQHYLASLALDGDNFSAWQQVASIDWELRQTDSMARHTEMALEYFPNQATLYLMNGIAQMSEKRYEEARASLEQGKMLSAADPGMQLQFLSSLADVYHRLEEHEKSDASFEAVLAKKPDDLHALNNYSYFLSLRKEKLDRAMELGSKLIGLAPDNGTYLDTYGWVLYVAGQYEEARKHLAKAAKSTDSGTVLEHYGDVLYKLGDKEGAMEQWRKAQELGNAENGRPNPAVFGLPCPIFAPSIEPYHLQHPAFYEPAGPFFQSAPVRASAGRGFSGHPLPPIGPR